VVYFAGKNSDKLIFIMLGACHLTLELWEASYDFNKIINSLLT